jgi:hypothetical protein
MHTGHAGALRQGLQILTGIDLGKLADNLNHKWDTHKIEVVDTAFASWKQCFPREFNRRPRKLELLSKWKMRECYVMGTRIFPALRVVEKHLDSRKKEVDIMGDLTEDQKLYFDNFLYLTAALRIVSSNSMAPIPPVSLVFCDLLKQLFSGTHRNTA